MKQLFATKTALLLAALALLCGCADDSDQLTVLDVDVPDGYALSAAQFGFTAGVGMVISVVCRLREVVWDAIGLLLMKKK